MTDCVRAKQTSVYRMRVAYELNSLKANERTILMDKDI